MKMFSRKQQCIIDYAALAAACVLTASIVSCATARADQSHTMALPNRYAFDLKMVPVGDPDNANAWMASNAEPYFQCDATYNSCVRGLQANGIMVGEVLAADRQTVVGHVGAYRIFGDQIVINYDTGSVAVNGKVAGHFSDIPDSCAKFGDGSVCKVSWRSMWNR